MGAVPEQGAGRRLHISHRTGYRYAGLVDASFNEVRMTPLHRDGQVLLSHALHVTPGTTVQSYVDYWGAHVESFDVHEPHDRLEVISLSTVDTPAHRQVDKRATWEKVVSESVADRWAEYLTVTGYVDDAALDPDRASIVDDRGYGTRRIDQSLGAAGIAAELREEVRATLAEERAAALALARKRRLGPFGPAPADRQAIEKQVAVFLRAGHRLDIARQIVKADDVAGLEAWVMEEE